MGIFEGLAKVVLGKALLLARYPAEIVCQHLDDVCAKGTAVMDGLVEFGKVNRGGTEEVRSDLLWQLIETRCHSPCHSGMVRRVTYDTECWQGK